LRRDNFVPPANRVLTVAALLRLAVHARGANTFQDCSSQAIGFFVLLNHCA
jgi:hypothetical protein